MYRRSYRMSYRRHEFFHLFLPRICRTHASVHFYHQPIQNQARAPPYQQHRRTQNIHANGFHYYRHNLHHNYACKYFLLQLSSRTYRICESPDKNARHPQSNRLLHAHKSPVRLPFLLLQNHQHPLSFRRRCTYNNKHYCPHSRKEYSEYVQSTIAGKTC